MAPLAMVHVITVAHTVLAVTRTLPHVTIGETLLGLVHIVSVTTRIPVAVITMVIHIGLTHTALVTQLIQQHVALMVTPPVQQLISTSL